MRHPLGKTTHDWSVVPFARFASSCCARCRLLSSFSTTMVMLSLLLGGCSVPTTKEYVWCKEYIDCCSKTGSTSCNEKVYGHMGTCWNTTEAAVEACDRACAGYLDYYRDSGIGADAGCTFR